MPPHTVFPEPCTSMLPALNSSVKLFFPVTEGSYNLYSLWSETLNRTCSVGWGCNLLGWEVRDSPQNPVSARKYHISWHHKTGEVFFPVTQVWGWMNEICGNIRKTFLPPNLFTLEKSIYLLIFPMMLPIALVFNNVYETRHLWKIKIDCSQEFVVML